MKNKIEASIYVKHFDTEISPEIEKYTTDDVFINSRYIFTYSVGKKQYGYCSHCKQDYETSKVNIADADTYTLRLKLKHNGKAVCPMCGSECTVKASGISRKYLYDDAYFVYYEKSKINPQAIVARGFYACRDYSGDFRKVKNGYTLKAMYVFEMGNSVMLTRYVDYSPKRANNSYRYELAASVYSVMNQYNRDMIYSVSVDSIQEAVKGTPFQYSTWESYTGKYEDMIVFFNNYSKFPCIEYLTKLGFKKYVTDKIYKHNTYSAINWKGKSILGVFRLSKQNFAIFKKANEQEKASILLLRLFQISLKDGSNLTLDELRTIEKHIMNYNDLLKALKYTNLRKAFTYLQKQYELSRKKKTWFYSISNALTGWKDYIADCIALEMNLGDNRILFPKNLVKAHDESSKRVKSDGNKHMDRLIQSRQASLSKYIFEFDNLIIRPALSTGEMIREGKELNICVGNYQNGYMTKYSNGKTNILLIRKADNLDIPFYTMEVKNNKIIQVHGKNHSAPDKHVSKFIQEFTDKVLEPKLKKNDIKISA